MVKVSWKKVISLLLAVLMAAAFAGCSKSDPEAPTKDDAEVMSQTQATTAAPAMTTEAPTTQAAAAETTTGAPKDGESIQGIIDTLESKRFYMSGTMNLNGGQTVDAKATCDGDNYRLEMVSAQMKMSIIYLDGTPYLVNNGTNSYVVIDDAALANMDQVMKSLSAFGVSFNSQDIAEMKNMMANFDQNMDYSQYINDGEYSEYTATLDGQEYLCSMYKTEYGTIRIYTQDGTLKIIDVFDADGLRQMNFVVSAFIPEVLSPISLTGYTKAASILNLFTSM